MPAPIYEFGPYRLEAEARLLLHRGKAVAVTPKGLDVLLVLVAAAGQVVNKEDLLRRVWPGTFVDEGNLTQTIFMLRKALGDGRGTKYIENVPRRGYRFCAPVEGFGPAAAQPANPVPETAGRWWRPAALLAASLTACLLVGWAALHVRGRAVHSPEPAIRTLAILPLENLSRDPGQDYLAEGITDALTTDLAEAGAVRVIARSSTEAYRGSHKPLAEIAHELHADAVVEGAVVREGDRVRITAQLVDTRNGQNIWASTYDRDLHQVITLENEVARDVAANVRAQLTLKDEARLDRTGPVDPEAQEHYLRGRYFWNKRTETGYREAIRQFQAAADLDPGFAPAYSGLADAYALLGSSATTAIARPDAMERARAAALRALQLDPSDAEAHASLGFVRMHYDWDFAGAEKEFRRAIGLNPSYATAHQWHAYNLAASGHLQEALAEIELAHRIDPLSLIIENDEGELLIYARQYDRAIAQFQSVLRTNPDFLLANLFLADVYRDKGDAADSLKYAERAARIDSRSRWPQATLAAALAISGKRAQALHIYRRLERSPQSDAASEILSITAFALGNKEEGRYWFEKAYRGRTGPLLLMQVDPNWDGIRRDAWFQRLEMASGSAPQPTAND